MQVIRESYAEDRRYSRLEHQRWILSPTNNVLSFVRDKYTATIRDLWKGQEHLCLPRTGRLVYMNSYLLFHVELCALHYWIVYEHDHKRIDLHMFGDHVLEQLWVDRKVFIRKERDRCTRLIEQWTVEVSVIAELIGEYAVHSCPHLFQSQVTECTTCRYIFCQSCSSDDSDDLDDLDKECPCSKDHPQPSPLDKMFDQIKKWGETFGRRLRPSRLLSNMLR